MKKLLTIITIMVILLSISIMSNATLELSEDNLSTLLDEVCGYKKTVEATDEDGGSASITVDFEDCTYTMDKNADNITLNMRQYGEVIVEYNLENVDSIIFTYILSFDNKMSAEDFESEVGSGILAEQLLFSTVAKVEGILPEDSYSYESNENLEMIFKKLIEADTNYSDGVTNAKLMYNGDLNISNEFMELVYEKESETAEKYNVKAVLKINKNADFSKLEGFAKKMLEEEKLDDWFDISLGDLEDNTSSNVISNSLENTDNNKENNVVANIQKIPQTGNEISFQKILYSVIAIATLLGIGLSIYNKKH